MPTAFAVLPWTKISQKRPFSLALPGEQDTVVPIAIKPLSFCDSALGLYPASKGRLSLLCVARKSLHVTAPQSGIYTVGAQHRDIATI